MNNEDAFTIIQIEAIQNYFRKVTSELKKIRELIYTGGGNGEKK